MIGTAIRQTPRRLDAAQRVSGGRSRWSRKPGGDVLFTGTLEYALTFPQTLVFVDTLEIAGAAALGRYLGVRVRNAFRSWPSHRPSVGGTLKIVRFLVAYVAILTTLWAVVFSTLPFIYQIALVIFAALAAGGVLDDRSPVFTAICSRCGKPMRQLAEGPEAVVFGCTCGATVSAPK
jgi:hypothetical protein